MTLGEAIKFITLCDPDFREKRSATVFLGNINGVTITYEQLISTDWCPSFERMGREDPELDEQIQKIYRALR